VVPPVSPPASTTLSSWAFVRHPAAGPGLPCVDVYLMAYAQARAVLRPSLIERLQRDLNN
jgi:hypothetical protein